LSSGIRLEDLTDGLSILGLTATPDDIKNSNYGMGSVLYDYDMAFKLAIRNYSNLVLDELEI
jgi:hypothetical protein